LDAAGAGSKPADEKVFVLFEHALGFTGGYVSSDVFRQQNQNLSDLQQVFIIDTLRHSLVDGFVGCSF
jgi:hypothetical protein